MIQHQVTIEGRLKAVKCTGDFGGPNMWDLYVQDVDGYWKNVQWMDVSRIQSFFTTKLLVYNESHRKEFE